MVVAVAVDSRQVDCYAGLEAWYRKQRFNGWFVLESNPASTQSHAGVKSISIHLA